jgi:hypothetical protein
MKLDNIQLYQRGDCIIIWFDRTHHTYWDYTQKEAIYLFKKKYGIKGKVEKTTFCPFIIN